MPGAVDNRVFDAEGWLHAVTRISSPNQDARPDPHDISLLVVHHISLPPGEFGGPAIVDLFCNQLDPDAHPDFSALRDVRVSAHFLITRGGLLTQFVACRQRAWHAGASLFAGRERCNDFSIGIELEGTGTIPYTTAQYRTLAWLTQQLRGTYPLRHVVGHSDIAPGRKTDPGPSFDWNAYLRLIDAPENFRGICPAFLSDKK